MGIEKIKPLNLHYSFCDVPSQYDEESLTALELCGRTARKMNEVIELLRETCKEQNMTIDEAVEYMKDNITDTTIRYLYELAAAGEIGILEEEHYNAIRKNITTIINVKEYGAKGDGVTDDTQAFIDALNAGVNIYIPEGVYKLTEGFTLDKYYHIYGEGSTRSVLKYSGEITYLFGVTTMYSDKPVIENIGFESTQNGFIYCSRGTGWGASVALRDCRAYTTGRASMLFESAFMVDVENCVFDFACPIKFTTFDGANTDTNFNNCLAFKNCFFIGKMTEGFVCFDMTNVRVASFDNCILEDCDTLLCSGANTKKIEFSRCWFEDINNLVDKKLFGDKPTILNSNFVRVEHYDKNATEIDYLEGAPDIRLIDGSTSTVGSLFKNTTPVVLESKYVYNPTDNYNPYYTLYSLKTNGATFNIPVNTKYIEFTFDDGDSTRTVPTSLFNLDGRDPRCSMLAKVLLIFTYADGDYIAHEVEVYKGKDGHARIIRNEEVMRSTWEGSSGDIDQININLGQRNNVWELNFSSGVNRWVKYEAILETKFCGY